MRVTVAPRPFPPSPLQPDGCSAAVQSPVPRKSAREGSGSVVRNRMTPFTPLSNPTYRDAVVATSSVIRVLLGLLNWVSRVSPTVLGATSAQSFGSQSIGEPLVRGS